MTPNDGPPDAPADPARVPGGDAGNDGGDAGGSDGNPEDGAASAAAGEAGPRKRRRRRRHRGEPGGDDAAPGASAGDGQAAAASPGATPGSETSQPPGRRGGEPRRDDRPRSDADRARSEADRARNLAHRQRSEAERARGAANRPPGEQVARGRDDRARGGDRPRGEPGRPRGDADRPREGDAPGDANRPFSEGERGGREGGDLPREGGDRPREGGDRPREGGRTRNYGDRWRGNDAPPDRGAGEPPPSDATAARTATPGEPDRGATEPARRDEAPPTGGGNRGNERGRTRHEGGRGDSRRASDAPAGSADRGRGDGGRARGQGERPRNEPRGRDARGPERPERAERGGRGEPRSGERDARPRREDPPRDGQASESTPPPDRQPEHAAAPAYEPPTARLEQRRAPAPADDPDTDGPVTPSIAWGKDDDGPPAAVVLAPDLPAEPPADDADPLSHPLIDLPAAQLGDDVASVAGVRLVPGGRIQWCDAGDTDYARGERVLVDSERGSRLAWIAVPTTRRQTRDRNLRRVIRRASDHDLRGERDGDTDRAQILRVAKDRAAALRLPMKVFRVEVLGALGRGARINLYYMTDERLDLRELIRDVSAAAGGGRVELRQLGVRDEAKAVGGIGSCGLTLCCTTWLPDFVPVSIKMAKDQGLVLSPTKVSGQCGRLKCCLVYEQAGYAELRKGLPKLGKRVISARGEGRVVEVDVLRQRIRVSYGAGDTEVVPATEVKPLFPSGNQPAARQTERPGAGGTGDGDDSDDAEASDAADASDDPSQLSGSLAGPGSLASLASPSDDPDADDSPDAAEAPGDDDPSSVT